MSSRPCTRLAFPRHSIPSWNLLHTDSEPFVQISIHEPGWCWSRRVVDYHFSLPPLQSVSMIPVLGFLLFVAFNGVCFEVTHEAGELGTQDQAERVCSGSDKESRS